MFYYTRSSLPFFSWWPVAACVPPLVRTVIGEFCENSKSQFSTFFAPTLWLNSQLSFQHKSENSNLRALLLLALEQILVFENPEAILIPTLKLNSQLSFQQNPILTELEFSQNFPITV